MRLLALIDTNVVVSGLLAGVKRSPNAQILDAMLSGRLRFVLSEPLLAEYRAVLLRPAIVARHHLNEADIDCVLESLVLNASFVDMERLGGVGGGSEATTGEVPGDEHVLDLLKAVPQAVLVSGDRHLREAVADRQQVLTPAQFAAILSSG